MRDDVTTEIGICKAVLRGVVLVVVVEFIVIAKTLADR
jgi:hypothetical protein